jgi:hypothetical protein
MGRYLPYRTEVLPKVEKGRRDRGVKGDRREWVRVVVEIYLKIFDGIEVLPKVEKGRRDGGVKGDRREWVRVVVEIYEDIRLD